MGVEADRVRAVFRKFDADNNGKLSVRELKAALKQLGVEASAEEAAAILRRYDSDHSQSLDIDEFTRLHDQLLAYERSHSTAAPGSSAAVPPPPPGGPVSDDVRAAFAHFDKDSNGRISSRELRSALTRLGIEASSDEASAILRKFDADGSGALELEEFAALAERVRAVAPAALGEVAREASAAPSTPPRSARPASAARRRASPPSPALPVGLGLEAVYDGQVEEEERVGQRLHAQLEAGRAVLARAAAGVAALDGAVQALRAQAARPRPHSNSHPSLLREALTLALALTGRGGGAAGGRAAQLEWRGARLPRGRAGTHRATAHRARRGGGYACGGARVRRRARARAGVARADRLGHRAASAVAGAAAR